MKLPTTFAEFRIAARKKPSTLLKLLALAALLPAGAFFPPITYAQSGVATLSCTPPTTNTDGSPFLPAQLPLTFKFFMGTTTGGPYPTASPAQTSCGFVFDGLNPGNKFFVATAVDKLGVSSVNSSQVTKAVVNRTPTAPSMLTVAADPTAYQIVQAPDRITLLAMGTVAPGTACDTSQSIADANHADQPLYLVPYTAVTLPNGKPNTKKQTVFASCG